MEACFLTDRGRVRKHNEDNGAVLRNNNHVLLAVVADGMGGHKAGDVASGMTVAEFEGIWKDQLQLETPEQVENWMVASVNLINEKIYNYASEHEECLGMGTTLVVAVCTRDFVTIGHIGDSRCYLRNGNGFAQITDDHSLVNELVRSGQISREDAELHPRKNVLMRALGTEKEVNLDITTINWEPNDTLLLCSDGLTNKVSDDEIEKVIQEPKMITEKGTYLIDRANELGGEDNISLAIIQLTPLTCESEVEQC